MNKIRPKLLTIIWVEKKPKIMLALLKLSKKKLILIFIIILLKNVFYSNYKKFYNKFAFK